MKRLLLLIASVFATQCMMAGPKNVNIDHIKVNVWGYQYPSATLPSNRTYAIALHGPRDRHIIQPALSLANNYNLRGWQRNDMTGEYLFDIFMDQVQFNMPVPICRYTTKKDSVRTRHGVIERVDTTFFFAYELRMTGWGSVCVKDAEDVTLWNTNLSRFDYYFKTPEYNNQKLASLNLIHDMASFESSALLNFYDNVIYQSANILNDTYAYGTVYSQLELKYVGNKKHPIYKEMWTEVNEIAHKLGAFSPQLRTFAQLKSDLQNNIDYLENIASDYDVHKRKDRKMRHIALYNLSQIYASLYDWDMAMDYTRQLANNGFNSNSANAINSNIQYISSRSPRNDWDFLNYSLYSSK